jgi:hypothetical protein
MWLAGAAMLILSAGYLLLIMVAGKLRAGREKDPAAPRKADRPVDKTS